MVETENGTLVIKRIINNEEVSIPLTEQEVEEIGSYKEEDNLYDEIIDILESLMEEEELEEYLSEDYEGFIENLIDGVASEIEELKSNQLPNIIMATFFRLDRHEIIPTGVDYKSILQDALDGVGDRNDEGE